MKQAARLVSSAVIFALATTTSVYADDIPTKKQTKLALYVSAREAAEMLDDPGVVFIDIRSRAEVEFLGLPTRANVHIPFMTMPQQPIYDAEKGHYLMEPNPEFEWVFEDYAEAHGITADTPIVLMCRSGSRSAKAANVLADLGFTKVFSLIDGYEGDKVEDGPAKGQRLVNGWKNAGLDWSYTIRPDQAYPDDMR